MIGRLIYDKGYPFISIVAIQLGQFIDRSENIIIILVIILQVIIGMLTIWKLHGDIKNNKLKRRNKINGTSKTE